MSRLRPWLMALALLGAGMAGQAAAQGAPEAIERGGVLNVAFTSDTKTLDPVFSINFSERQPLYLIYNTLLALKPDSTIGPELAESWTVGDDGRVLTLHLRSGVTFHDGTPLDAAAVKFNLDRRLDPAVASPQRSQLAAIVEAVVVKGEFEVEFRLKGPSPALLGMLAQREGFIASPTAVGKLGADFARNPVGSGPFLFKEWTPGRRIVVERNPDYWEAGKPYLDRIVFNDVSNAVVAVQRLLTGEIDYISALSPTDVRQIENRPGIRLEQSAAGRLYALQWQVDRPPFNNERLRQAVAHAVDRKRIVDILMGGKAPIAEGMTAPVLWWQASDLKSYSYDPAKAKALLAEAGYPNGLEVPLSTPQIPLLQQVNQLVQEQLKAVGIAVKLDPVAQSDWYPRIAQGMINFSPIRWSDRPDPDGLLTILLHSKGNQNSTKYANPEVDALLDKGRSTTDQAERTRIYQAVQRIATRDLPYVPLFFSVEYAALRDGMRGHVWIPDEIPRFREVWKAKGK